MAVIASATCKALSVVLDLVREWDVCVKGIGDYHVIAAACVAKTMAAAKKDIGFML